jgi:hypothetical protein
VVIDEIDAQGVLVSEAKRQPSVSLTLNCALATASAA